MAPELQSPSGLGLAQAFFGSIFWEVFCARASELDGLLSLAFCARRPSKLGILTSAACMSSAWMSSAAF